VLTSIRADMTILREETFGPLTGIMAVPEAGVAAANDPDDRLGATATATGRASWSVLVDEGCHPRAVPAPPRWLAGTPGTFGGQWARTGSAAASYCGAPGLMSSPQMIAPAAKIAADHQNAVV
jgi:hypothetical protein